MNLFESSLKLKGFPIAKAKRDLKAIRQIPENEFKNYVETKREAIVKYHLKNTAFYRKLVGTSQPKWEDLPIMTKSILQQPLENRLSNKFNKNSIYVNKTSGSSGTPFIFGKDKYCHALSWAKFIECYGLYGIDLNASLQARFYGIPLDSKAFFKERFKDFLGRRYRFPIFDLSDEKLEEILNHFQRKKFDYINGYTSVIVLFAKFLQRKNLILKKECPTLKCCIVTSEMLFEDDKKLLEKVLNIPVINEYGASECGLIAFTDKQHNFLVNSDDLFVEILDEKANPVPNGKAGRIVITSLYNKAHPIIRYDIGDVGVLNKNSTYKQPILEKLLGRTNDFAKLPSGKVVPALTFYYITKTVITNNGNVKEFIIEQIKLNTFKIKYVASDELSAKDKEGVKRAIAEYLEKNLIVDFERLSQLERSPSGKLKQFIPLKLN